MGPQKRRKEVEIKNDIIDQGGARVELAETLFDPLMIL